MSHCNCLRGRDVCGRCDHRVLRRKYLHLTIVRPNGYLLPTVCTEVVAIVAHFHAVREEGTDNPTEETTANRSHSGAY
jgi:hypothetical protein